MLLTARQTAIRWSVSPELVRRLCRQGRIFGARRIGGIWAIPSREEKPPNLKPWQATKEEARS